MIDIIHKMAGNLRGGIRMAFGKMLRTGVMCAMGMAFSMMAPADGFAQKAGGFSASKPVNQPGQEAYTVTEVHFNYDQMGNVDMALMGFSNKDSNTGQHTTVTGLQSIYSVQVSDNSQGVFGLSVPDARLQSVKIEYLDALHNNQANFQAVLWANTRTSDRRELYHVQSNPYAGTQGGDVHRVYFSGENIPVVINRKATGRAADMERRRIENATDLGAKKVLEGLPVKLNKVSITAVPEGGTARRDGVPLNVLIPRNR